MNDTPLRFWTLAAIVAAVAVALYMPTWRYDYTYLDDNNLILEQQSFLSKPSSLYEVFGRSFFGDSSDTYYRPVVNLSFAVNAQIGGVHAFGYHLVNCLLHAAACVLLLALFRGLRIGDLNSFFAALFFAIHPVHAASVAWIPGRNDALVGCFTFCACLLLLRDARRPGKAAKIGHLLCLLLALFTKETALCLPLLFIVLLWAIEGRHALLRRWWMWAGWAIAMAVYFAARHAVITSPPGYVAGQFRTALQGWPVLLSDLGKLLLPVRLQVIAAPVDTLAWPGIVVAAIIGASCFIRGMRRGIVALALAFVALPLLMSLLGAKYVVLETRLYLPIAGVGILLGELLRATRLLGAKTAISAFAVVAVFTVALGIVTMRYIPSFHDRDRFSNAAISGSPNSAIAHNLRFKALHPDMFNFPPPGGGATQ